MPELVLVWFGQGHLTRPSDFGPFAFMTSICLPKSIKTLSTEGKRYVKGLDKSVMGQIQGNKSSYIVV